MPVKPPKINLYQRFWLVAIPVIILLLILMLVFHDFVSSLVNRSLAIVSWPYNYATEQISRADNVFGNIEELSGANLNLKQENIRLLQENINLTDLQTENLQLKQLLKYVDQNSSHRYVTARIYAIDPLNISDTISLDQGNKQGITKGNIVIFNGVYLGKIIECDANSSRAKLITSPGQAIVGAIPEADTTGIVKGQIGFGLTMEEIPPDAKIRLGQPVTTANLDPTIPPGLLIGEITETNTSAQEIFQTVTLRPYFNLKEIRYVLVQLPDQ
jgi:rod shape-determining protein MreC